MPDVTETTVYRLDELSEAAKGKARAWYREGGFDYDWYDAVYEDFRRIADILGISVGTVKSSIWRSLRRLREDEVLSFGRDEEDAFGELVA